MKTRKSYITEDGEVLELDEAWFREARRGRPELPETQRKKRVNLMLDPDVVARLKEQGNMSAHVNALLRKALGVTSG